MPAWVWQKRSTHDQRKHGRLHGSRRFTTGNTRAQGVQELAVSRNGVHVDSSIQHVSHHRSAWMPSFVGIQRSLEPHGLQLKQRWQKPINLCSDSRIHNQTQRYTSTTQRSTRVAWFSTCVASVTEAQTQQVCSPCVQKQARTGNITSHAL